MRRQITLVALLLNAYVVVDSSAQKMPLVYGVENTGADCPQPYLPSFSDLPTIQSLPDPFLWADGRGRISHFSDWRYRRVEIGPMIQNYEQGTKPPRPDTLDAHFSAADSILTVTVTVGGKTLTLTSKITPPPSGTGPFPAVIGIGFSGAGSLPPSIFTSRNIAMIRFDESQVTSAWSNGRGDGPFFTLYPDKSRGKFIAWAWGISRIIDGLEKCPEASIDLRHLALTGCSYAGKIALFGGALDERIALTISQESGGGGYTAWRVTQTLSGSRETLANAQGQNWWSSSVSQFNNAVTKLPYDHHELMGMVAPRALYVTGNPDYEWLADESGHVASKAAKEVYKALGVSDRFGFSIVGGHTHCQLPSSQTPQVGAFVDKFLLGDTTANTNIETTPYTTNLSPWITWTTPTITSGTSFMGRTSLVSPSNLQKGLDKNLAFTWNKGRNVDKYFIQLSTSAIFADNVTSDSTTDTVKTISDLGAGKKYYWRVQEDSAGYLGPWSDEWYFSTYIPLPAAPELGSVTPLHPDRLDSVVFKWKKAQYADKYIFQLSTSSEFKSIFLRDSTADTVKIVRNLVNGATYYWRVQSENVTGYSDWTSSSVVLNLTGVKEEGGIPVEFSISQNYPNPFNPTTTIRFGLPKAALTKIVVYDLLGREIRSPVNKVLEAGYHEVTLDSSNLPTGVYFYKIQSGEFTQTKKMIVLK